MKPAATFIVRKARAGLVRRYRAHPQGWPDGIDGMDGSGNEQWYRGHEHEWTDELIAALLGDKPEPVSTPAVSSEPVSTLLVSSDAVERRRAYMRELMRAKRAREQGADILSHASS